MHPKKTAILNALSVDVEDYFMVSAFEGSVRFENWPRYESRIEMTTLRVLDLLEENGIRATFFILGWVAERHPRTVREIKARGHEIASHGYNHRLVYNLSRKEFREDIRKSKNLIEDLSGSRVIGYRAPSYSITKESIWALDILIDEGFAYDSSIFPIRHDRYGFTGFSRFPVSVPARNGEILEIPPSTVSFFGKNLPIAGGGYLRLFPLKLIELGIGSINTRELRPAVMYFHPWELDPGQPRISAGMLSMFRHRVNLDKTEPKLKRLFENFRFAPFNEIFAAELDRRERVAN